MADKGRAGGWHAVHDTVYGPVWPYWHGVAFGQWANRSKADQAAAVADLLALIEAAESTEPRDEPPTMTGFDIAHALAERQVVEARLSHNDAVRSRSFTASLAHHLGNYEIVARVVEPPPPQTRTVRADELRPGMVVGSGDTLTAVTFRADSHGELVVIVEVATSGGFNAMPDAPIRVLVAEGTPE